MGYEDKNINEVLISGVINKINCTEEKYIKFSMISNKITTTENDKVFISLNIRKSLYETYKDFFFINNKVFVKGYLNSYTGTNNVIKNFITVTGIANNYKDIEPGYKYPHIRYEQDNVMVWNGTRCEVIKPTTEEIKEMDNILKELEGE